MSAHTPGPWTHIGPRAYTSDTQLMATAGYRRDTAEEVANIRLIAAAPELLTWLRLFIKRVPDEHKLTWQYEQAIATIAKATGSAA